jgi:hypothetical protein
MLSFRKIPKGKGRRPGRFAPVDMIRQWVASKRIQFRDLRTGRFLDRNKTAYLVNKGLKDRGSQVYQNKRAGIDMDRIVNESLDKTLKKFGDEILDI